VSGGAAGSRVQITTHPLWRLRVMREFPRYLLGALAVAGLAASARFAIAPPRSTALVATLRGPAPRDRAAEGYAVLFTRRYLSWNAAEPQAGSQALQAFSGGGMEADAGLQLPPSGEQRVEWAEVVQQRERQSGDHVFTIAAQTDTAGLLYMTVGVKRTAAGSLALDGYPAFVGAPASAPTQPRGHSREVTDPELATVVQRALRNYLAASAGELAADLARGARVSLPGLGLTLASVLGMDWSPDGRSVVAVVLARDARGVAYTLAYELDVAREEGRWEVSAVQMDPNA
jgi:conjugative transposon protein TcpC